MTSKRQQQSTSRRYRPRRPALFRLLYPFQQFVRIEASSGILLLICTVIAMAWANSPFGDTYRAILSTKITLGLGDRSVSHEVLFWINDGLMAVFFFVVGLEIKREIVAGELASRQRAALPAVAALGGMVVPAAIYAMFNAGGPDVHGWGVPMATDIAFAIGVLALLGPRVPPSLKVFLTALAIVDDIGAVVVIALFYGHAPSMAALLIGGGLLLTTWLIGRAGARSPLFFAIIGIPIWIAFLISGVHATVAGVLLAFAVPARTVLDGDSFRKRVEQAMSDFAKLPAGDLPSLDAEQQAAIAALESACEAVQTPLQRMERMLHPWVSFGIMPLFALANAGVHLGGIDLAGHMGVPLGVGLGLLLGKPLGITLFSWISVKLGIAARPSGVGWKDIAAVGSLGGIGFTMALFIASLAFSDPHTLGTAKVSILASSAVAGTVGYLILRFFAPCNNGEASESGAVGVAT